jgi:N-acetylglucosamine-6-phosphate deacetylase
LRAIRGDLVTPFQIITNGQLELDGPKITYIGPQKPFKGECAIYKDSFIVPGFIDIHVHGLAGYGTMDVEEDNLRQMSRHLAMNGVKGSYPHYRPLHMMRFSGYS